MPLAIWFTRKKSVAVQNPRQLGADTREAIMRRRMAETMESFSTKYPIESWLCANSWSMWRNSLRS